MGYEKVERDLAFIKRTMEAATRYDNIPPVGYLLTGLIGAGGAGGSYFWLGGQGAADLGRLPADRLLPLGLIWGGALLLALAVLALSSILRSRARGITAWSSLATRMFASQLPLAVAAGLLTVGLIRADQLVLVPAVWLLLYGVIAFSFSYFSGRDHQLVGLGFLGLGAAALFGPPVWGIPLLGAGFGGLHVVLGLFRMIRGSAK